jgi:hypothetical protein
VVGLARSYTGGLARLPENKAALDQLTANGTTLGVLTPFLLLRAFSSGAVALTGVEAISNGVPAFKRPESKNAATTLVWGADPRIRFPRDGRPGASIASDADR